MGHAGPWAGGASRGSADATRLPAIHLLTAVLTRCPGVAASRYSDVPALARALLAGMVACRGTSADAHDALVDAMGALVRAWAHCLPHVLHRAEGGAQPFSQVSTDGRVVGRDWGRLLDSSRPSPAAPACPVSIAR